MHIRGKAFLHYTKHAVKTEEWLLVGTPDPSLVKHPLLLPQLQRLGDCQPTLTTASTAPCIHTHYTKKELLTKQNDEQER